MTAAEARALGLDVSKVARVRTTRRVAKGDYHTRCHACAEEFRTMASEDRHLNEQRHFRYELVLPERST